MNFDTDVAFHCSENDQNNSYVAQQGGYGTPVGVSWVRVRFLFSAEETRKLSTQHNTHSEEEVQGPPCH